ncbi:MAG: TIM barrel protein [bacterium]
MRLGLVTYNIANDWDLDTLIEMCIKTDFEGVELRTTHKHGVEPTLTKTQRAEVRKRFEDSPITLWGLGSICEYDSPDKKTIEENIETAKIFAQLAHDVGARGVKVRPNRLHADEGIPVESTLEQIGKALRKCGETAKDLGVEIWLEVHGQGTDHVPHIRTIMDAADHDNVFVCWNSNDNDRLEDGTIGKNLDLLIDKIHSVHMRELHQKDYPFRELFGRLRAVHFNGFCLAEIQESGDPEQILRYYSALFREMILHGV